jgi:hypothetical protein
MKLIKKLALAAALSSFAMAASAMDRIQDADLSQVSGQDGVSIAANLNVNIGSFTYTNTSTGGGSVSFNNIGITGVIAATLDVISGTAFQTAASALNPTSVLGVTSTIPTAFYNGTSDVVQIAIPTVSVDTAHQLNVKVGSITMGGGLTPSANPSFGAIAMNNIQLQGTTAYIWAH